MKNDLRTLLATAILSGKTDAEIRAMVGAVGAAPAATAAPIDVTGSIKTAKEPKARTATVETVSPKDGQDFAPFKVLATSNGCHGKFHRGVRANTEDLRAIVAWLKTPAGQAFLKSGAL